MQGNPLPRSRNRGRCLRFSIGRRWCAAAQKQALALCLALPAAYGAGPVVTVPGPKNEDFTGMELDQLMQVKVPIVYGASKHEQKITEAPSAVTIVTKEDIQQFGY